MHPPSFLMKTLSSVQVAVQKPVSVVALSRLKYPNDSAQREYIKRGPLYWASITENKHSFLSAYVTLGFTWWL